MLEQILDYIHNYFVKEIHVGHFEVVSGSLNVDFLQENQYFEIVGSVFNDGLHQYPAADLADETFEGEIWAMAVPPAVVALADEIEAWVNANSTVRGPFQSESFGGYSYSRGLNSKTGRLLGWQEQFAPRLNRWRKIS